MRAVRLSLRVRLLATHLLVALIGLSTLVLVTELVAPQFFATHVAEMMRASGAGAVSGLPADAAQGVSSSLRAAFETAITEAALVAAGVAAVVAGLTSLLLAAHITRLVHRIAAATRRIAAGHYAERVAVAGIDPGDDLGHLAQSFNAMAEALGTTERRRIELLGDVAHELRTPISTLEGYLEGLLDGLVAPTPATWARLHDEAGRLHRLVDDLQELSRAESHQFALTLHPVDPRALARTALDRLAPAFAEKGLALVPRLPPEIPAIHADGDRVGQVLTNLLTNALRYTPAPGQVTLAIRRVPGESVLLFAVTDTGIGLAATDLPRVFERFYRVDKSRSRASGGSGIGLTIAGALVEAMGGRIGAASAGRGQGSTFWFTVPLAAPARRADGGMAAESSPLSHPPGAAPAES